MYYTATPGEGNTLYEEQHVFAADSVAVNAAYVKCADFYFDGQMYDLSVIQMNN